MQKRVFLALLLAWVATAPLWSASWAQADTLVGKVVAIADGDTVTVLDRDNRQHRIRLAGIDAPERRQPYYQPSRQHLAKLAFGRHVTVEWHKTDRYKRIVGNVLVAGEDVGLSQVRAGLAWWYRDYAREQSSEDRRRYEAAENEARSQRRGLWQEPFPTEPKRFRRERR